MCGLAGVVARSGFSERHVAILERMTAAIAHRGPDGQGLWTDPQGGAGLGHRRLSIIDLSSNGDQPMASADGRYMLVLNGEIYNFETLRARLQGEGLAPVWRGHSDTEVLLACLAAWGVEATLPRIEGMFAFALWDRRERTLTLARDRFGEKPLYYGWAGGDFVFASELTALRAHPQFDSTIDRDALAEYLAYGYVPHPRSIYAAARKLEPGCVAVLKPGATDLATHPYWSAVTAARQAAAQPFAGSFDDAVDQLDGMLRTVVGSRMISDVPLGAFLSGGLDSSTVVALMQSQSTQPVRTFTIGTDDPRLDESADARAVAEHLGTEHTEFRIGETDLLEAVPMMAQIYDEPFADSSQIPTYMVSRLARRHVTVALSGDGGDEMFGGYYRYRYGPAWNRLSRMPRALRTLAVGAVEAIPTSLINAAAAGARPLLPERRRGDPVGDRLKKSARKWTSRDQEDYLEQMYRICDPRLYVGRDVQGQLTRFAFDDGHAPSFEERAMLSDVRHYLPGDLLVKVDRASMACGLEARAPFLDSEVFAFAWSLPLAMKIDRGEGKKVLRGVLARHLPRALWERPKKGFGVPIDRWLRSELRDWAGDLLSPESLARTGLLNAAEVNRVWDEHQRGLANHASELWTLLMFQAWSRRG